MTKMCIVFGRPSLLLLHQRISFDLAFDAVEPFGLLDRGVVVV
jgi:hypothetical protein